MRRLNSAALFSGAAAEVYRKRLLRSVPISHRSLATAGGFGTSRKPYLRKKRLPLPAELSASGNVAELSCESAARGGVCDVYLVGTRHDTKKSKEEVKAMIQFVKPEVVFLEVCPDRASLLEDASTEFYVANEEAIKHGAKVELGDRPIDITWARLPIMRFLWELLLSPMKFKEFIEKHKKDILGASNLALDEIQDEIDLWVLPSRQETLLIERDQYMSATLLEVARQHNSVVAVVGKGHLRGIQKYWKQPIDMRQLLHTPTRMRMVLYIREHVLYKVLIPLLKVEFPVKRAQTTSTDERKIPPPELLRSVVRLRCESSAHGGICDVYLVGSKDYAGVVQLLKPQVVFLEMCSSCEHRLTGQKVKVPTIVEMVDMLKKKQNPFWRLYKCFLSRIQPQLQANDDFRLAYEEAIRHGRKVIFGDRPREITYLRLLAKISLGEIFSELKGSTRRCVYKDMHKKLEITKDDVERAKLVVQAMDKVSPTFTETFIHESDRYMSAKLLEVAREHNTVVAVVEWVHLPGIQKHWKEPVDMKQLRNVPMGRNAITRGIITITLLIFMNILMWFTMYF